MTTSDIKSEILRMSSPTTFVCWLVKTRFTAEAFVTEEDTVLGREHFGSIRVIVTGRNPHIEADGIEHLLSLIQDYRPDVKCGHVRQIDTPVGLILSLSIQWEVDDYWD